MQAASDAKVTIKKSLRRSASSITISLDEWTANNGLDFLGVTTHNALSRCVRKLHNLVAHIQRTPKRRRFFEMKQNVDPESDDGRICRVIVVSEPVPLLSACRELS